MKNNGKFNVVVADKVSPSGLQALTDDARFEVVFTAGGELGTLEHALARADALIVRSATKVTSELLASAPELRAIGRAGVGVDNIDLDAATARGVPVLNAPAGNTVSAAELTFALILATARRVPSADRSVRAGEWQRSRFAGIELRGKTLGLIGAGRIGSEVAKRARGFGMRVFVHDPYLSEERATRLGVSRVSLDEILERADVVSLHVPLTEVHRRHDRRRGAGANEAHRLRRQRLAGGRARRTGPGARWRKDRSRARPWTCSPASHFPRTRR